MIEPGRPSIGGQRRKLPQEKYTQAMEMRTTFPREPDGRCWEPRWTDSQGHIRGPGFKDIAVATGADAGQTWAGLVLKTRTGLFIVPLAGGNGDPCRDFGTSLVGSAGSAQGSGELSLPASKDLVDRQIIDIHGRQGGARETTWTWSGWDTERPHLLRVAEVEVGLRGAFRRVFKGVLPRARLESISRS